MNQTFTLSTFQSVGDTRPVQIVRTWEQLCRSFAKPVVRREKDGLLFSPAKYRAPRRLIANVIELSLLVLEVDGAWKCEGGAGASLLGPCGHRGPLVLFRNAKRQTDHCPRCKQDVRISQIHFDLTTLTAAARKAFPAAFAIYSTHSHKRNTYSNANSEPRFRIVIPLSEPVPVADFLELWHWAVDSLTEIPADPQVKDPNRIYYTPAIYSAESPYEFHIEPGAALDWESFVGRRQTADGSGSGSAEQKALTSDSGGVGELPPASSGPAPSAVSSAAAEKPEGIYDSREARHEELCRRIIARGKLNTRGNWDARCLAHGGKGTTAILYNPRTGDSGAVSCNRGCSYEELLVAEGLDDRKLPTRAWLDARGQSAGNIGNSAGAGTSAANPPIGSKVLPGVKESAVRESFSTDQNAGSTNQQGVVPSGLQSKPPLTLARLHVINSLLLAHLFELTPEDETTVRRYWGDPFSEEIEWPGTAEKKPVKVCSFPSRRIQLEAVKRLSQEFNLEGVPGFYRLSTEGWGVPGPELAQRQQELAEYGPWRLSLDQLRMKPGALLVPYDNQSGYICGIRIFRAIRDKVAFLLTSRGLPGGASAVGYRQQETAA